MGAFVPGSVGRETAVPFAPFQVWRPGRRGTTASSSDRCQEASGEEASVYIGIGTLILIIILILILT
ncbi:MAG TPA: hypothetical protein VFJ85_06505 [Acidimicrobiales bacterium]|nr:hypothetical protein [Acidimicrobiales bacterium]